MPKVELEIIEAKNGLIKAPSFCPYKKQYIGVGHINDGVIDPIYAVNSSLCPLCKICQFEPKSTELTSGSIDLSQENKEKVIRSLQENQRFLDSVMRQILFLQKNERIPLAIFVSFNMIQDIIAKELTGEDYTKAIGLFTETDGPICFISAIPVYFSRKLTKSLAQVVGEVEWE